MIRYSLICERDHEFDGWFSSSDGYEEQAAAGEVACPQCGSTRVSKALMAPNVARGVAKRSGGAPANEMVERMSMVMLALKQHVEENCDYVGDTFAEEARRIHYGETEHRDIYGEATLDEARELIEEGVTVAPLPIRPTRQVN